MREKRNNLKYENNRVLLTKNNFENVSLPPAENNHAIKMLYLIYSEKFSAGERAVFEDFLGSSTRITQRQLLRFLSDNPEIRKRIWEKT